MKAFQHHIIVCFLGIIFLSACNSQNRPADLPKLHPVSVVVTQKGKELADANVTLHSIDSKWSAISSTNSSGEASDFYTNGMYPGVAAGRYRVCISKSIQEKTEIQIPPRPSDPGEYEIWRLKYDDGRTSTVKNYDVVLKKYADPDSTDLEAEVVPGKNKFSFDVGEPIRILETK